MRVGDGNEGLGEGRGMMTVSPGFWFIVFSFPGGSFFLIRSFVFRFCLEFGSLIFGFSFESFESPASSESFSKISFRERKRQ